MAAEARIIFRAEARQAQSEIQNLRGKLAQLNQTLAEQRNRLIGATAEEQKNIRAHITANTALKATIRSRIEQANLQKQAIAQTQREARERERAAQQQVRASQQMSAAQRAVVQELTIGARVIFQQLSRVTGGFVRAAADMETFRNTIHVVTQDAGETNRVLGDLLKLTVDLVGIDTRDLISYAGRLMAAGLSAEQAQIAISGVTKRIAEQGRSTAETRLSLEQITQSFNTGRAVMFDFRTLMRLMPRLWDDISNALGENVRSTEDFNRVAQAAGGHTQALITVLTEMDRVSPGANLDTLNAQMDILVDLSRVLAAELGAHLVPAIVAVLKEVNRWIERFIHLDDRAQALIAWAAALATTVTGLVAVIGTATLGFGALSASLSALTGASGVAALTAGVGGLVSALAAAAPYLAVGGIIVGGIALLAKAIDDTSEAAQVLRVEITRLDKVMQVYNVTTGELERLTTAQATSYANFQERVKTAQAEVQSLSTRLQENREEQEKLNEALKNVSSPDAFLVLERDLKNVIAAEQELVAALNDAQSELAGLRFEIPTENVTEPVESLEEQIVRVIDEVRRLRDTFRDVSRSGDIQAIEQAARDLTRALARESELQLQDAELTAAERLDIELELGREIERVNKDAHDRIGKIIEERTQRQFKAYQDLDFDVFWRVASGTVDEYAEAVSRATVSVVDHQKELEVLQSRFFDGLNDPIADYVSHLEATSVAADAALGTINQLGEGVRDADFRRAEVQLRDFEEAFRLSEATIPRVTSEMRKFAGQVPPATQEVIEFRRELETLNRTGETIDLSTVADALNIQADPLQGARHTGRDALFEYYKNNALRIGEELGSQAIRTAGELRRIEQERIESLSDLEREYSEQIIAINERKRERLAEIERQIEEERVRRLASIQEAFDDAKNAEIEARQEAADRIQQIEARAAEQRERLRERLNERLIALEERRDDRIQALNDGFLEREQARQQEILDITQHAAAARVAAEQAYADRVQAINNRLVEQILAVQQELAEEIESLEAGFVQRQQDRADRIVEITQEAAEARAAANQTYVDTMQDIYNDLVDAWDAVETGFTQRQEDRAAERIRIEERAAQGRIDAYAVYNKTIAEISTDLVDEVRDIQDKITEVLADAATQRIEIERDAMEQRQEANIEYAETLEEIEANRDRQVQEQQRRITEIQEDAAAARLQADERYADRFQGIQNDLVDRVVDIQRDLNDTLNDLRDEQLDAERDRLDSLVELHEDTQQRLEDLERDRNRTVEDLRRKFQQDQLDAAIALDRELQDAEGDPEKEAAARQKFQRRIEDLTREFHRRQIDLQIHQRRQREALAQQAAAKAVEIAERAQARLSQIEQQQTDARSQAQAGITAAEAAAGVSFEAAQANYVPALSAHEEALRAHAEALNTITAAEAADIADVTARISEIIETSFTAAATAAMTLAESLAAVDTAAQQRSATLETETTGTVAGLNQQIADAEARTGITFEAALQNYTPAVDLNTQALNTLTETLSDITLEEQTARSAVSEAERLDRVTTTAQQEALVSDAGVSLEDARANYVPALTRAAIATETLNATMQSVETAFRQTIADIHTAGLVDRQAVDTAVAAAIADAAAQQTALETQAGTTFAAASAAFQPGRSDIAQAGVERDTAFREIDQTESEGIDAVNAQSIADRLETDAAITQTRDTYIKARDTEIFKHNAAMLQLNLAEAADIKAVRATLHENLESIDDKLDVELAEIRETKIVFDTRIGELIDAINAEANQDVSALKADTAAMRSSLEAIAEEERNNAWKSGILKLANVGITVAGVAAGTVLGNPVAGLAVGQVVGGLVEQGGNELFHYERTDAIARRLSRHAAFRGPRPAPNYLPTSDQLRNARDVGREVVAGFAEGLQRRERTDVGGISQQERFPEERSATLVLEWPDGATIALRDQILRLEQQDR